tara:strand:- start:5354 stop:6337 length:984 start_codon:yes stop_codon:yes gene_type:complete
MANIIIPGLPAKIGTILNGAYLHLNESGVDKKVAIAQLLAKIEAQYSADIVSFLGSANKAEGRANLSIDRRTTFNNVDYTINVDDRVVSQVGTMSSPRTLTLPSASLFRAGGELIIFDESGSVNSTNKITVQRAGTDTIDGLTSLEITSAYGILKLICNGADGWISNNSKRLTGEIKAWASSSVPSGYLECNGAEVAISSYGNLSTAIYAGDSNNADTDLVFGYKTNGSGTRSTSGTHIKLPDLRGEFIRGWDNSRGIDGSRKFGSYQVDELKSHSHFSGWYGPRPADGGANFFATNSNAYPSVNTGTTGGDETRPRNISLMYIIKT